MTLFAPPTKVQGSFPGATVTVYLNSPAPSVAISAIARASNVVTVTVPSGSGFISGQPVTIAGVSDASYNGTFTISSTTATSFTYAQTAANSSSSGGTAQSNLRLAQIYADNIGTVKANPFTAGSDGTWNAWTPNGLYDVQFSGGGLPVPFTISAEGSPSVPWINVKDGPFLARGDGASDDTAAIQAACNAVAAAPAGGRIYIPAGTYIITAAIKLGSKTMIYGDGPQVTIIHQTTAYTAGLSPNNGTADFVFRDLTLQGTYAFATFPNGSMGISGGLIGSNPESNADADWAGSRVLVENVWFQDWGFNGMPVNPDSKVVRCRFINIYNEPMIIGGDNAVISNNYISGCGSWGIDVNGNYARVEYNILRNTGLSAAHDPGAGGDGGAIIVYPANRTHGLTGVKIIGNDIDGSEVNGIVVYANSANPNRDVIIAYNTVRNIWSSPPATITPGALQAAIKVHSDIQTSYPIQRVRVIGNTVGPSNINGISVVDSLYVDVSHNTVDGITSSASADASNSQGNGIIVYCHTSGAVSPVAPSDINVSGNTVTGCAVSGIALLGVAADLIHRVRVIGNTITSPTGTAANTPGLSVNNVFDFIVEGNLFNLTTANYYGIWFQGNSDNGICASNHVINAQFAIVYETSVNDIAIVNNNVGESTNGVFIRQNVPGIVIRGNYNTNPVGSLQFLGGSPAVPASGAALLNPFGYDCFVAITAGANPVNSIGLGVAGHVFGMGFVLAAGTSTTVLVPALYSITLSYPAAAPTWQWYGN